MSSPSPVPWVAGLGREARHKDARKNFHGYARARIGDGNCEQRPGVLETVAIDHPVHGAIHQAGKLQWMGQRTAADFDGVPRVGALETVGGQVEDDLHQVRAVDLDGDVFGQRFHPQFVFLHARMDAKQFLDFREDLVDAHDGGVLALALPEKPQVAARRFRCNWSPGG